jgi:glutamate racemase
MPPKTEINISKMPFATNLNQNNLVCRIGIFDSGEGGTRFTKDLLRRVVPYIENKLSEKYPNIKYEFFILGDGATCPWGPKPEDEIIGLAKNMLTRMKALACNIGVIACNTACVALEKADIKENNVITLLDETVSFFYQRSLKNYYEILCKNSGKSSKVKHDTKSIKILERIYDEFPNQNHQINVGILATQYTIENNIYPNKIQKLHEEKLAELKKIKPNSDAKIAIITHSHAPNDWVTNVENAKVDDKGNIYYPENESSEAITKDKLMESVKNAFNSLVGENKTEMVNVLFGCTHYGEPALVRAYYQVRKETGHLNTKVYPQGEMFVAQLIAQIENFVKKNLGLASEKTDIKYKDVYEIYIGSTGSKAGHKLYEDREIQIEKITKQLDQTPKENILNGKIFRLSAENLNGFFHKFAKNKIYTYEGLLEVAEAKKLSAENIISSNENEYAGAIKG